MRRALLRALAAVAALATAAVVLGGAPPRLLVTSGVSMAPAFSAGDLAVLRPAAEYRVGDVVAYRSRTLGGAVVLHRVVDVRPDGSFTTRGDNNSWLDPDHPTQADMVGRLVVRVPQGGVWLRRATSPVALGLVSFTLIAAGAAAGHVRRSRRRRRTSMTPALPAWDRLAGLPPLLRTAAAWSAGAAAAGAALALLVAAGPSRVVPGGPERAVTFSYSAQVPQSAAYETTTARSPDPVYRTLADEVQVHLDYRGEEATLAVAAELEATNGWSTTAPLLDPVPVRAGSRQTVGLDLAALDRRLRLVSAATGMPVTEMTVTLVATVRSGDDAWEPRLRLAHGAQTLALADGPESLRAVEGGAPAALAPVLRLLGQEVPVPLARAVAGLLLLGGLLGGALVLLRVRRLGQGSEVEAFRRGHASLLLRVDPVPLPPGRPVVDVAEPASLVRLAERYGLLVLHWERSGVETFVVQDEGTTYRYRAGAGEAAAEAPAAEQPVTA